MVGGSGTGGRGGGGGGPGPRPRAANPPVTNSSATVASPAPTKPAKADDAAPKAPANDEASGPAGPDAGERQWLIRLENGEQKSCRELATLQQWIVAGKVSRESLISRSGKTWKRLGDIAELAQYFSIADEARTTRDERKAAPTGKVIPKSTMMGVGAS